MADSRVSQAVEKRLEWLRWCKDKAYYGLSGTAAGTALPMYENVLETGDTFYMNTRFCQLTDLARQTIPDNLQWEMKWTQAPQGWMWLEEPFKVPTPKSTMFGTRDEKGTLNRVQEIGNRVSAIGWFPVPEGHISHRENDRFGRPNASIVAGPGATQFVCFMDYSLYNSAAHGFGLWSYFMIQDGDVLIDRVHKFESIAYTLDDGGEYPKDRVTDMLHEVRWIYAAFHLMSQKLTATVNHTTSRAVRRRWEVNNKNPLPVPPFIKYITLRKMQEDQDRQFGKDQPTPVNWQWQWVVSGFWRNQWYPGEGVHKPKWIDDYVKGPSDRPLKPPQHRIYVAER